MTRIVVDAELRKKLLGLTQPLQLCDETGLVIAQVTPGLNPSQWESVEPETSEEELERRRNDPVDYSTAEGLAYLEKL
jgi:hypothetical protein